MTHFKYRPARVYAVETARGSHVDASAESPNVSACLEDALAQLGAYVYIVDRELRLLEQYPALPDSSAPPHPLIERPTLDERIVERVAPEHRAALQTACDAVISGGHEQSSALFDAPAAPHMPQTYLTATPARSSDGAIVGATLTLRPATPPTYQTVAQQREAQRTALLRLLNHTGARLASELNEDTIVQIVTEALVAQLGLAFARIWLFDPATATLVLRSSAGLYTDTGGEFGRIPLGQHTVGQIAAVRRPLITNDVPNTPGLGDREWALAMGMRGFAGYPLLARDRLIGVVAFFSYTPLDKELIATLEPLAHQVALALERAQLSLAQVAARDEAQQLAVVATSRAAQLSATLGALADGVWTCDQRGRLLTVNAAALEMFGFDPAQTQPTTLDDLVSLFEPETPQREVMLGLPAALEGRALRHELLLRPAVPESVPMSVLVTATPMRDQSGAVIGAVAVVHNMTQQRAMERLKDDFLSVAAHELKTPVTAIKGYAQLALMRLKTGGHGESLQRALHTIEEQSQRIAHLVDELVDVSRIQGGQLELRFQQIDLVGLAKRTLEQAQQHAPQHRLVLEAPPSLPLVVDAPRIEQVLQNLLENAIKYSPDGSTIRLSIQTHGELAHIAVVDPGVGIPPDKQEHVFEAWFQAHGDTVGDFGGMGLGLSICKEIVERHGGRIWVDANQAQGSRFCFTLPLPAAGQSVR